MRWLVVLALIASVAVVARAEGDVDESDVVVLGNDDFDAIVNAEELMLVEFYAPWCGHCKRLTPEYAKAATALRQVDPPVKLAKVDATVHGELASRFNVHGYPTLKVFRNGKPSDYNGPREADGIVNYMKKQVGPAAKPVESVAELEKYISSNNYFVAGFFQPGTPTALQSGFLLTANKMRDDYVFVKTTNADVLKKYNVESEGIIAFKVFDERQAKYTGKTGTKAIEEWVSQNALPIVGEFNATTADAYNKRGLPILKVYTKVDWGSNFRHTQYFINRVKDLAVSKREELLVALVDTTRGAHEIDSLGLKVGTEPIVLIEDEQTKYISPFEKFSADNVKKFYDSFDKGEAEKFVKSEKPPAKNDGPVKVVTGKTFNEIVKDDSKDVLIEFYAPWCGHCKSLEPKYNDLGKRFKKFSDKVTIAKIDATANDYPRDEFQVNGFPTIYFKPAKFGAKPISYDGERDADSMEKFVKKHAANKLKKKD